MSRRLSRKSKDVFSLRTSDSDRKDFFTFCHTFFPLVNFSILFSGYQIKPKELFFTSSAEKAEMIFMSVGCYILSKTSFIQKSGKSFLSSWKKKEEKNIEMIKYRINRRRKKSVKEGKL